jgi:hypothetical protein
VSFVPDANKTLPIVPAKLNYLDPAQPDVLDGALRWHVNHPHYIASSTTVHGTKYVVECSVHTPEGHDPCILSV